MVFTGYLKALKHFKFTFVLWTWNMFKSMYSVSLQLIIKDKTKCLSMAKLQTGICPTVLVEPIDGNTSRKYSWYLINIHETFSQMNIVQANKSLKNLTRRKTCVDGQHEEMVIAIIHPKINILPSVTRVSPNLCKIISATE